MEEEKLEYRIVLHCYAKISATVQVDGRNVHFRKNEHVGGAGITSTCTLDQAKAKGRDLWNEYHAEAKKQIRIIGPDGVPVFEADNFNKFP